MNKQNPLLSKPVEKKKICPCIECGKGFAMPLNFAGRILCEDCDPFMSPPKLPTNKPEWEKELITRLGKVKIDHTDIDDDGYNRLCSEEINKIMDIFDFLLHQRETEILKKIKPALDDFYSSAEVLKKHGLVDSAREMKENTDFIKSIITNE